MGSFWSELCSCSHCCKTNPKKSEEIKESIGKQENNENQRRKTSYNENSMKNNVSDQLRHKKVKKVIIDPNSDQMSIASTDIHIEEEGVQQFIIDEQKLREELANSVKGGKDSYERVMIRHKPLSMEKYNEFGLIDLNSEEFSNVKDLMNCRGYRLIESIDSGNYADVYKARGRHKDVAIKVIDSIEVKQKYGITFLSREVNNVRELTHKNIIKIHQIIRFSNKICVVMELAPNRSVADLIAKRGALTEFMSWFIFGSILEGLDHMHSHKLAHRNLKLENILLTDNFNPKISDFCFALIVDQKRPKSETIYGFPYFAPEILQHLPYNPFISDIWSLGVCLYIMANDCLPFKLEDETEMLGKQLIGDWKFSKTVESMLSQEMKTFVGFILEPDISLRPTTKHLLKQDWIQKDPSKIFHQE